MNWESTRPPFARLGRKHFFHTTRVINSQMLLLAKTDEDDDRKWQEEDGVACFFNGSLCEQTYLCVISIVFLI